LRLSASPGAEKLPISLLIGMISRHGGEESKVTLSASLRRLLSGH